MSWIKVGDEPTMDTNDRTSSKTMTHTRAHHNVKKPGQREKIVSIEERMQWLVVVDV